MDEKGRIRIPTEMRKKLRLTSKQLIFIEVKNSSALLKKASKPNKSKDKVLRDIFLKPGFSKVRMTTKMLNAMKDEVWTP